MIVFKFLMYGLQFISSISLIVLVVSQTSRHEGLGAVGGQSAPSMRGRAGIDEQLQQWTKYAAISFLILSLLLFLFARKFGWT
jgi:protein translocase SecG subunit